MHQPGHDLARNQGRPEVIPGIAGAPYKIHLRVHPPPTRKHQVQPDVCWVVGEPQPHLLQVEVIVEHGSCRHGTQALLRQTDPVVGIPDDRNVQTELVLEVVLHRSHLDLGRKPVEVIRDPLGQLGLQRLTLLDEDFTRHEYDHTSGPGVIGGHAVVVSKYLRPSAHEPSSMGQPRELRGDRRRHASPVKLLTQPKTTGLLIQRLSLRGMATTSAEPARTNVAKSTNLQHQEHGSSRPRGSGSQLARSGAAVSEFRDKVVPAVPDGWGRWRWLQRRHPRRAVADPSNTARMSAPGRDSHCQFSAGWRIRAQCRTAARKPSEPDANTTHFPRRSRPCSNRNSPRAALCRRPTVSQGRINSALDLSVNAHTSSSRHQSALLRAKHQLQPWKRNNAAGRDAMLDHATLRTRWLLRGRAPRVIRVVLPVGRSTPHDALVAAGVLHRGYSFWRGLPPGL